MPTLADNLLAAVNFASRLPLDDIMAAASSPSSLAADAKVAEDIIGDLPMPPIDAVTAELAIAGFAALVEVSGGGTIAPDPLPMTDAQTTDPPHSGRRP